MAKRAQRDWITNEEAAQLLGISRDHFFKTYCQRFPPLNSVCVGRVWLHYLPDILKVKERRDKDPAILKHRKKEKPVKITPLISEDGAGKDDANAVNSKPEEVKN